MERTQVKSEKEQYIDEMLDQFCNDWEVSYLQTATIAELLLELIEDK